ncbi:MAG: glycosyltransferase family 2 protein [Gammaproteobacteria bacterium]|nr:glycosyltransferase family 2 protein [Gammaproteobacteria bacterium]MBU0848584.1 glycosyltransferase family 2 protein [Gammaproteobacteria bacterium]MBU1267279.1 glycosyltransferase family 2 protein [Gammaproteobacteria bacterium]MBU1530304.1 glycosyltransferase family 2 protein [Gammaproteobacteria bacterium]MBU1780207.1 glycosyltransferase family 2 protein [Gammaproteobacteria bacterium]
MLIPKLSICIATFKRGRFIGETLESILAQLQPGVEIVVVDGASPDDTPEVMARYAEAHPGIRYFREAQNSGVDADFDKAVSYAKGEYCWLMTDDDLLRPGAVAAVLSALEGHDDLIIVNSEVLNVDLSELFEKQRLIFDQDKVYRAEDREAFFIETAAYLSFIGCVVIKRAFWMTRERATYYGSLFIHVGVIFQNPPLSNVRVIAEPLITIRYGNAMWTSRSFEIWMFKWPGLIWSFPDFSEKAKRVVCRREPWRSAKALFHNRALGAYSLTEYRKFWRGDIGKLEKLIALTVSIFPASLANLVMITYFTLTPKPTGMAVHDLLFSKNAGALSRFAASILSRGAH